MFARRSRHPAYTDDDPPIVRALRAATEPPPWRLNFFFTGCLVEATLLMLGVLTESISGLPRSVEKHAKKDRPMTIVYIPPSGMRPQPPPPPRGTVAVAKLAIPPVIDYPTPPKSKIKVRLGEITINIAEDTDDQLPSVVRQQNGTFAVLDPNDPSFTRYTFDPPDWQMHPTVLDVRRRMKFRLIPPSNWPLLRSLAESNNLKPDNYQVDALFDGAFSDCLEREIRNRSSGGTGQVTAVSLAFNSSRSCGIDVLKVDFDQ